MTKLYSRTTRTINQSTLHIIKVPTKYYVDHIDKYA